MNSKKTQELLLIGVPYAALLALALLGMALGAWVESGAPVVWTALRWLVRIGIVAGAIWGWRTYTHEPRPLWWYAWLGFVAYEVVAVLLAVVVRLMGQASVLIVLVAFPLLLLALVPAAFVALWVALRSPLRAAYTVFPYAAVTVALFALSGVMPYAPDMRVLTAASLLPIVVAGAAAMLYVYVPQRLQWLYLYGAVVVCQLLFTAGIVVQSAPVVLAPFFVGLGLFLLSAPVVLLAGYRFLLRAASRLGWAERIPPAFLPASQLQNQDEAHEEIRIDKSGGGSMAEQNDVTREGGVPKQTPPRQASAPKQPPQQASAPMRPPPPASAGRTLDRLYKSSVVVLTALIVLAVALVIGRAAIYKVHEYERGLHLRGGRFVGVQMPGWHVQIPLVDTVILVKTNERLGYVEQISAMTSDNVTMIVSLQYTYKVHDPEQYALQVDDPERIVFEFVQGKLRDVVNTKEMADVMNNRAAMNQEVMEALKAKEEQYGVQFVTVQMQSASPPEEVMTAIKDRMVAVQRQEQAQAEAAQSQTLADANLYAAEKEADAEAYQITTTALADAERIRLTTAAEKEAVHALLEELEGKGAVGEKFIEYLIAQELKENSKWVINGESTPILDMR